MAPEELILWMRAVAKARRDANGDDWVFFQMWWWDLFDVHKQQLLDMLTSL